MENEKKLKRNGTIALAICVAIIPALWAVLSPYAGIQAGPVALICAGIFFADAGKAKPINVAIGFIMGLIWGVLAVYLIVNLPFSKDLNVFVSLAVMAGLAVIFATLTEKFTHMSAWLGGLAMTVLILIQVPATEWMSMSISIGVNMLAGVFIIGVILMKCQGFIAGLLNK
jgi:hypothetical protein